MKISFIAGFAVIAPDPAASKSLYVNTLALPLNEKDNYLSMDGFDGAKHFGVWPLRMAAQSCFGSDTWPADVPIPHATIEFELSGVASVEAAVEEMKRGGAHFVHNARLEPWGQTVARFLSPEGLLIGLTFTPWLHK
jgi:catechol 2,3-dioxygenase-like lactoylglutathione lyase family enzyme